MKLRIQVVVEADGHAAEALQEIATIERGPLQPDDVGLTLAEAKNLLHGIQQVLVERQVAEATAQQACCPACGQPRRHKGAHTIVVRSLFGTLRLPSPRLFHCPCQPQPSRTFSPLATLLPERTTPELRYLEAKFASLMSYGLTAQILDEVLPLGRAIHPTTIRNQVRAVARRLEGELGEERPACIEGCQRDWDQLPRPDLPLTVGLDGGYVHSCKQTSRRDGWFEVIAGKSMPTEGADKCFAFVQGHDRKPKRRLFDLLTAQGMQPNQRVTFLTDGGETVRDLPLYLNPLAEHLLDWFHVTMRLTVMGQYAKGLPAAAPDAAGNDHRAEDLAGEEDLAVPLTQGDAERLLASIKWYLWHGNVHHALQEITDLAWQSAAAAAHPSGGKLAKAAAEFHTYIANNAAAIPNYGERYRHGEAISSASAESAVNQVISKRMVKQQQMRWSPEGAHLLLQVRTRVLNDDLRPTFHRWYPALAVPSDREGGAA